MENFDLGWNISSSTEAARETDHYFFRHRSMNVPHGEPCAFFGDARHLTLIYHGIRYSANFKKHMESKPDFSELSWGTDLGTEFADYLKSTETLPILCFRKRETDQYEIYFRPGTRNKEFRLEYEDGYQDWTEGQLGRLISTQEWGLLLGDSGIFHENEIELLEKLLTFPGHAAAVSDLTKAMDKPSGSYSSVVAHLGYRILDKLGLPRIHGRQNDRSGWSVPFLGKTSKNGFCWKLRPELAEALQSEQTSKIPEYFKRLRYNVGHETIKDCLNDYFGCSYKDFRQVIFRPDEEFTVWFAQIAKVENGAYVSTSSMGWINVFSEDENILYHNNKEQSWRLNRTGKKHDDKFIVFSHEFGDSYWRYKGIYIPCGKDSERGEVRYRVGIECNPFDGSFEEINRKISRIGLDGYEKEQLKEKAAKGSSEHPKQIQSTTAEYQRNEDVARYARFRAKGICQLCGQPAPFTDINGKPFLEVHHIVWLSQGGGDTICNTIALCPNCHRKMHALNLPEDVKKLQIAAAED